MLSWFRRRRQRREESAREAVQWKILTQPRARHYADDLSRQLKIRPTYLYPALHGLLEDGIVVDGWEPGEGPEPPRRFFQAPTPNGQAKS